MIKRLIGALFLFGIVLCPALSKAESTRNRPDIVRFGAESSRVEVPTRSITVDFYGNILPGRNKTNNIGSSTETFKAIYSESLNVSSGISGHFEQWEDLPVADSDSYRFGGIVVTTTALRNSGTTFIDVVDLTQSTVARNVVFFSTFTLESDTVTLRGGATFYGTNSQGQTTSEFIFLTNFSSSGIGNVAWALVSSVTIECSSMSPVGEPNIRLYIGTGNKIGLANAIDSASDLYKVSVGSTVPTSTVNVDTSNGTVTFPTVPNDNRDYKVWYLNKRRP